MPVPVNDLSTVYALSNFGSLACVNETRTRLINVIPHVCLFHRDQQCQRDNESADPIYDLDWPCATGIVLSAVPGGTPIIAVSYS